MAYYGKSRKTVRTYARSRYINKPVKKALKPIRKKKTGQVPANKRAIVKLGKQVNTLQNRISGQLQWSYQSFELDPNQAIDVCTCVKPMAFMFNDFTDGSPLYGGSVTPGGAAGGGQPTVYVVKSFRKKNWMSNPNLQLCYQWAARAAQQTSVSKVSYNPISAYYRINFKGTLPNNSQAHDIWRYRITVFSLTTQVPHATNQVLNMTMPSTLGAYWHMVDTPNAQNRFSKTFHKIHYDRFVTFKPDPAAPSYKEVDYTVSIPYYFPKGYQMTPDFLNPIPTPPQPVEFMWTNTPQHEVMWCLLSCDAPAATTIQPLTISMSRFLKWTDPHGKTK